jgi:hydrogenase-4 component B
VTAQAYADSLAEPLGAVSLVCIMLIVLVALFAGVRALLLKGKTVTRAPTWGCGYTAPTPRMQYTASSFAEPIVGLFRSFLGTRTHLTAPSAFFPREGWLETETPDFGKNRFFSPVFAVITRVLSSLRFIQQGRVQLYILYIVLTLIVLLLWNIR